MRECMTVDKKNTEVAVIVLTYGDYRWLDATLASVAKQSYPIRTVIVSDDGANGVFPIRLREKYPGVLFRRNVKNIGTVAHMNLTAALTDTPYIKFLSAGDAFSSPSSLASLMCFATNNLFPVVASQATVCDETLQKKLYSFPGNRAKYIITADTARQFKTLAKSNIISAAGTLFHRSFFLKFGGFDEAYHFLEDWPTWLRITRQGVRIPFLNQVTCAYGIGGGISSEGIDAYASERLRADMKLCYEKEILPYLGSFHPDEVQRIQYGYDVVRGMEHSYLVRKYGWLEQRMIWKRRIKQWLLKSIKK